MKSFVPWKSLIIKLLLSADPPTLRVVPIALLVNLKWRLWYTSGYRGLDGWVYFWCWLCSNIGVYDAGSNTNQSKRKKIYALWFWGGYTRSGKMQKQAVSLKSDAVIRGAAANTRLLPSSRATGDSEAPPPPSGPTSHDPLILAIFSGLADYF